MRSDRPVPEAAPGWLVSPRFDAAFVLGPVWVAGLVALAIPRGTPLPAWGWVALVLGVDVAHVWSTLYRTYLDPEELGRRPLLYALAPAVALIGGGALMAAAPGWYWTALAYLAAFHFVRQAVGIGVLYRARSGRPTRDRAGRAERAATWAVTLGPLWWWHTALPQPFAWFVDGDFVSIPAWTLGPAIGLAAATVGWHVVERLRERRVAVASDLWLAGTAVVWIGGIAIARSDAAFTVSNVVAHGVPYVALVWWTARRKWAIAGRGAIHPALFEPLAGPLVVLGLVALAYGEEALWDALVWQDHPTLFGWLTTRLDLPGAGEGAVGPVTSAAIVVLSVPQVTHYLLDGFVWKLGPTNPDLRRWLGLDGARSGGTRSDPRPRSPAGTRS
ncbi:MAG: hypothetical protein ABMB14_34550 [Myxococcota bacterium]